MNIVNPSLRLYTVLRIACAMCFIGHGAFGIITKPIWCNYFAVFGIGKESAYTLMPLVGAADIALGITILVFPIRAAAAWLVFWGLFTASLRPLSGEPFAEFLERAGNYGAPFALLLLAGHKIRFKEWFIPVRELQTWDDTLQKRVKLSLQIAGALLLAGHGWLNLMGKQGLLSQYTALGFGNAIITSRIVGSCELLGALLILIFPSRWLILALFIWKVTSEMFYPVYGLFEWVERGGSYAVLLALWLLITYSYDAQHKTVNLNPA